MDKFLDLFIKDIKTNGRKPRYRAEIRAETLVNEPAEPEASKR